MLPLLNQRPGFDFHHTKPIPKAVLHYSPNISLSQNIISKNRTLKSNQNVKCGDWLGQEEKAR